MRRLAVVLMMGLMGCGELADFSASAALEVLAHSPQVERFSQVDEGVYRGGAVTEPQQMKDLQALGIKTIVNLQNPAYRAERPMIETEKQLAAKSGIRFLNLAMGANAAPRPEFTQQVLRVLTDPAMQPVYIHCKRGRDRTGTMVGAYRVMVQGWTGREALDEMARFDFDEDQYPFFAHYILNLGRASGRRTG